jgi:hypothetical protein
MGLICIKHAFGFSAAEFVRTSGLGMRREKCGEHKFGHRCATGNGYCLCRRRVDHGPREHTMFRRSYSTGVRGAPVAVSRTD